MPVVDGFKAHHGIARGVTSMSQSTSSRGSTTPVASTAMTRHVVVRERPVRVR